MIVGLEVVVVEQIALLVVGRIEVKKGFGKAFFGQIFIAAVVDFRHISQFGKLLDALNDFGLIKSTIDFVTALLLIAAQHAPF